MDPAPRLPIDPRHRHVEPGGGLVAHFAVSCVGHSAALRVPELLDGVLRSGGVLFDWNSVSPATKMQIRDRMAAEVIDVALLDSLDTDTARPNLAVSGAKAYDAARTLGEHGFAVNVVGSEVGQAARLKYLRSVFMKGLEGLVIEYTALEATVDPGGVIRRTIEANLGRQAMEFLDLLLATDRVHAGRRASELEDAVSTLAADGVDLCISPAATDMLRRAAAAWAEPAAPAPGSANGELALHLGRWL